MVTAQPAQSGTNEFVGNFNESAALDISQVEAGDSSGIEMFCFDNDPQAWDCYLFENMPENWDDECLVWAGPVSEIQAANKRLGSRGRCTLS